MTRKIGYCFRIVFPDRPSIRVFSEPLAVRIARQWHGIAWVEPDGVIAGYPT